MSTLAISLFGYPRVLIDGVEIKFSRTKTVGLIAYLAVKKTSQSRDLLAALFWPEADGSHAKANLRLSLTELTKAIGKERLNITRERLQLRQSDDIFIDVEHFRAIKAEYDRTRDYSRLKEAVSLYGEDFMKGFNCSASEEYEDWMFFEAEELRNYLTGMLQDLVALHNRENKFSHSTEYAARLHRIDSFNDEYIRLYMEAL